MATRTPLVRLEASGRTTRHQRGATEIFLKLETLQPTRSFKIRGAFELTSAS